MIRRVRHWFTCRRLRRELQQISLRLDRAEQKIDQIANSLATLNQHQINRSTNPESKT